MSIQFKFRSSVSFDSVQIDGRDSISVGDLRAKVVRQKNLNICQDFDLVFSDSLTGREFNDDDYQIPSGSSVIIKRVPAGTVPSTRAHVSFEKKVGFKDSKTANMVENVPLLVEEDLDDFGADFCPVPNPDSDMRTVENNRFSKEKQNYAGPSTGSRKLDASDLSEASPIDAERHVMERKFQVPVRLKAEECMKVEKTGGVHCPALLNVELPSELKCSICNTYFKEAVMIPCCQHSFCETCIRAVLIEKARCPKCFSSKCNVGNLLPNLSLRHAIERFLETQYILNDEDKDLHNDAPDGESGIQAKDVSYAVTKHQRDMKMPVSPSATERGSNQIVEETGDKLLFKSDMPGFRAGKSSATKAINSAASSNKFRQIAGERIASAKDRVLDAHDFQGENEPHDTRQRHMHEGGGDRILPSIGRYNKGVRTCHMCGSPDHFIRDCPIVSNPQPILPAGNSMFPETIPGYGPPFWNGMSVAPIRPYNNMFGNFGMMPFTPAMLPASPYGVSPYMTSMYGGQPVPSAFMRTGDMSCFTPQDRAGPKYPLRPSETLEHHNCKNRGRITDEGMRRDRSYDDDGNVCPRTVDGNMRPRTAEHKRSCKYKAYTRREKSPCCSGDRLTHRSEKKRRHEQSNQDNYSIGARDRSYPRPVRGRSNSGIEDVSFSSDRHSGDRHIHHYRTSRNQERKDQCDSGSSRSGHQTKIENNVGRKRFESDTEPNSSVEQKKRYKDKIRISKHLSLVVKPGSNGLLDDRWQMASRSDEDDGEGYHYHKRKRVH